MIPACPVSTFILPLTIALVALLAAGAYYDVVMFRRRRPVRETVYRCDACRYIYTAPRRTPLARCPKCGQPNEPVRE